MGRLAEQTGAIPFDVPGVELGHHAGKCSFEAILAKYELADPALARLAKIVRADDLATDMYNDKIAPGLEAIATGFGFILPDDQANLSAQSVVYDALYAWCRLQVASEQVAIRRGGAGPCGQSAGHARPRHSMMSRVTPLALATWSTSRDAA